MAYPFLLYLRDCVGSGRPFWLLGHFFRLITASGKEAMPAAIFSWQDGRHRWVILTGLSCFLQVFTTFFASYSPPLFSSPRLSLNWMTLCRSRMEFDPLSACNLWKFKLFFVTFWALGRESGTWWLVDQGHHLTFSTGLCKFLTFR